MLLKKSLLRLVDRMRQLVEARPVPESSLSPVERHAPPAAADDYINLGFELFLGRRPTDAEFQHYQESLWESGAPIEDFAVALMSIPEFRTKRVRELEPFDSTLVLRTVNGHKMMMPLHDWVYDTRRPEVSHEPWVAAAIRRRLGEGSVFVDIGANVGVHSVLASQQVGPTGRVLAVEALPANAAIIMKTIATCGYSNIVVCAAALSDKVNVEWLTSQVRGSNQNLRTEQSAFVRGGGNRVPVLTLRGDLLMESLDRLDLVKIDVEGRERSVLTGMRRTLERFHPDVIAEFHTHLEEADFVELLLEMGYEARILHEDGTLGPVSNSLSELAEQTRLVNANTPKTHSDLLFQLRTP